MEDREQSADDKSEEASDERRKQYREEGNVANPRELMAAVSLLILTLSLSFSSRALHDALQQSLRRSWAMVSRHDMGAEGVMQAVGAVASPVMPILGVLAVTLTVVPTLVGLLLTRFNWSWKKLEFNLEKLNPVTGMSRVVSYQGLAELAKSIIKLIGLTCVCYVVLKDSIAGSGLTHFEDSRTFLAGMNEEVFRLLMSIAIAGFVLGAADFFWNWYQLEQKMKMSKQDLKEESKSQEGDPHVKSQRRRMARDIVTRKTLAKVPEATFVVTNPTHFSVAIRYVKGMSAPVVVAKGQDFLALRIREIAKDHDIILVENKALARTLYKTVKVGGEVPASLYASVIEVMKYIYGVRGKDYFSRFSLDAANR